MNEPTFRILGDLEVVGDTGPVTVGGRKRRALLAYLLVHAGRSRSIDAICDAVWDGDPGNGAASTVRTYVSQFRKQLPHDLTLEPDALGYRITLADQALDAQRFEQLVADASSHGPSERLDLLEHALILWRGEPLAEFADAEWATLAATRLNALRTTAIADRFESLLGLARHHDCLADLVVAVDEAPFDERLAALLALARYRTGDVSTALRDLAAVRRRLAEELGISPGAELVDLERRMLDRDPDLTAPPTPPQIETAASTPRRDGDRPLPRGTVTFLFTDIEGSTQLLRELGDDRYAQVLADQRRRITDAIVTHDGVVFGTEGDALFCAFASAPKAAAAAAAAQAALFDSVDPWIGRVRMGLHTGDALVVADDYVGTTVHIAARVAASGHGGQIVASAECHALTTGLSWTDLGVHRLKDVDGGRQLFQLDVAVGPAQFPRLSTADSVPTNVPDPVDSFVGRHDDVTAAIDSLGTNRLLTVLGPGGVGKTRLAIEIGRALRPARSGGVHYVELAHLAPDDDVEAALVRTIVENGANGGDLPGVLADIARNGQALIILDNCEHVLNAASRVTADVLAAQTDAQILATSREALHVRGERVQPVHPLDVTAPQAIDGGPADAAGSAVQLFAERAESVTGRPLRDDDIDLVVDICRRVDGLPLAIELAASRTTSLAIVDIAARLDDRFTLLRATRTDRDDRHRTIEAVIDWSYELLAPVDRALFNRLAILDDVFTLDVAETIAGDDDLVPGHYVIDGLGQLVDKSLARLVPTDGVHAYQLLATLRGFGRARLAANDELDAAEDAVLHWSDQIVGVLERAMRTADQDAALREVLPHRGNLRQAVRLRLARGEHLEALRIVASAPIDTPPARCRMLDALIPEVARAADPRRDEILGRAHLAGSNLEFERGDYDACAAHGRTAASIFEQLGDSRSVAWASYLETFGAWGGGDEQRASAAIEDARQRFALANDDVGSANAGWVAVLLETDLDQADAIAAAAEEQLRSIDAPFGLAHCLEARALVDLRSDRAVDAAPRLVEALAIAAHLRNDGCSAHCLEAAAGAAAAIAPGEEERVLTAELLGAADELRVRSGHRHRPWELGGQRAALDALATSLPADVLETAMRAGRAHDRDSAIELATRLLRD